MPIFATEDWPPWLTGMLGGGGGAAVATAVMAGLYKLAKWWQRYRAQAARSRLASDDAVAKRLKESRDAEERRDRVALDEWKEVVSRQNATIRKLERAEEECRQREVRYQEDARRREMKLQQAIVYLHTVVCQQCETMRANGMAAEQVRSLSEFLEPSFGADPAVEERRRSVAQAVELVKGEAVKLAGGDSTPPPGGEGERP